MIVKSRNPPIEADVIAVNRSGVALPVTVTTNSREGKSVTYAWWDTHAGLFGKGVDVFRSHSNSPTLWLSRYPEGATLRNPFLARMPVFSVRYTKETRTVAPSFKERKP